MKPIGLTILLTLYLHAQPASPESRTASYMETLRKEPTELKAFLRQMPKGGDLHNHLEGAIYAESFIKAAAVDGLCVDSTTIYLVDPPCGDGKPAVADSLKRTGAALYSKLIDAFSMHAFEPSPIESSQDHFFVTFNKFSKAALAHSPDWIAEDMRTAADHHVQYVEVMYRPDAGQAILLGAKTAWNPDLAALREAMLPSVPAILTAARKRLDDTDRHIKETLKCETGEASPACQVSIRYLHHTLRGFEPVEVFSQLLIGFELASSDSRVTGINMVMPEHWYIPMRDYELHMKMVAFLHKIYPKANISLHAGELVHGQVPPEGLRFHIAQAVQAGATRIGHGVDIMEENTPYDLMKTMAVKNVLVEICLTSNEGILGVKGDAHPLPIYLKNKVPVTLATDDLGVSRGDMTEEYFRAARDYHLSYQQLKSFARQSIEHAFIDAPSRARERTKLESSFTKFESQHRK